MVVFVVKYIIIYVGSYNFRLTFVYEMKHDSILLGTTGTQHIAKTWFNGFYMHSGVRQGMLYCFAIYMEMHHLLHTDFNYIGSMKNGIC